MKPESFSGTTPPLTFESYFVGTTHAAGMVFDRSGTLKRQFTAEMFGQWDEPTQTLTLNESFRFSDGEQQNRTWTVKKRDQHTYEGTADDVVGKAIGRQFGSAIRFEYVLRVPIGTKTYAINFEDWLFLQADGTILNKAVMRKFGFRVGELIVAFRK
ncbi:MAG: DUF3833 domain-containing protein [Bdellovibrionota bacterium]